MTRAEIRAIVLLNTARSDKSTLIDSAIDLCLQKISNWYDFSAVRTETDLVLLEDYYSISLPTDYFRLLPTGVKIFQGDNVYEFEMRTKSWVLMRWPKLSVVPSSIPAVGYEDKAQGKIFFAPPADGTYTLRLHYSTVLSLPEDTDSLPLPTLDEAVIAYATSYIFKGIEKFEEANIWMGDFISAYREAKHADEQPGVKRVHEGADRLSQLSTRRIVPGAAIQSWENRP